MEVNTKNDTSRNIRAFLWKILHDAYKVGDHWLSIPEYEHRARCVTCQCSETREHILTECNAPGRRLVWKMAQEIWQKGGKNWPNITIGIILGSGMANFKGEGTQETLGLNRLFTIIITESAYLI